MINRGRLSIIFFLVAFTGALTAQQPDSAFWVPNGPVNSLLLHDTTVILGGEFDQLSPVTGSFVRLDTLTGQPDPSLFKVNGPVHVTLRDHYGYVYVGGSFSRVDNLAVQNLFRMKPDGTFDHTFMHNVAGSVYALYVLDTVLFIGGDFTHIDGETRSNFGALNLNTGLITTCNPVVNGPVYCMDYDPGPPAPMMIIGGDFNNVYGFNPPNIAKFMISTGYPYTFNAVPWTAVPNINGPVHDLKVVGPIVYIAGEFTMFGPTSHPGLAAIVRQNGNLLPPDAQVAGEVYTMEFADSAIYIGGNFTQLGSSARSNLAKVDYDFAVQPWDPGADGAVYVIEQMDSTRFFVGGDFSNAGGDTCRRAAIIDTAGAAANWNPMMNATVYTAVQDTARHLYIGGEFYGAGGALRNNLCALSLNSGVATAWAPDVNAAVRTMTLDGDSLYLAGSFTMINGVSRGRIAAIDLQTEMLLPFNPVVNGLVRTIAITDSAVYAGGNFTSFGGETRGNIGKVSKSTGLAIPWHPNCLGTVNSILVTSHWVYVAGFYSTISGVQRQNLSRIHPESAVADISWLCDADDGIYHAEFYNNSLLMTGWFNTVNGQSSPHLAMVDTASLQVAPVNFSCDGFGRTFTRYGDDVFVSGMFELVNNIYRPHLVAYDAGDNAIDSWAPFPDAEPQTMQATATRLFVGGTMSITGGRFQPNFQVLPVQWVTSVDEASVQSTTLHVFPNPVSDKITVSNTQEFNRYTLTDITGQIVTTGTVNAPTLEISLAEWAPGMYVLTMSGDAAVPVSQTVIKE